MNFQAIRPLSHEEKAKLVAGMGLDFVQSSSGLWLPSSLHPGYPNAGQVGFSTEFKEGGGDLISQYAKMLKMKQMALAAIPSVPPPPPPAEKTEKPEKNKYITMGDIKLKLVPLDQAPPGIQEMLSMATTKMIQSFGVPPSLLAPLDCNCSDCVEAREKKYASLTNEERFAVYAEAIATTLPREITRNRERIGELLAISQGCFEISIRNLGTYHKLGRK
jgi:hypothetical protein